MNSEKIRQSLDENLSGLYVTEGRHRMMMNEITTGGSKVKKRFSLSLIVACVLILALASMAYAIVSWRQMAETTAQLESHVGYFENWNSEQKATLLEQLVECGEVEDSETVQKALHEAKTNHDGILITSLLEEWIGLPEDAVTFTSIMERILGKFESWSVEDKAWYSDVLIQTKRIGYDEEIHILPTSEDLQQSEALSIAKAAMIEQFQLPLTALDNYEVDYDFYIMPNRENDKRWLISFRPPLSGEDREYSVIAEYTVCVTNQGEVTADDLRGIDLPWENNSFTSTKGEGINGYKSIEDIQEAKGDSKYWTLEERAYFISWYGLPSENDVSEEEAIQAAQNALADQYPSINQTDYTLYAYFIIDDPYRNVPYWQIVFSRENNSGIGQNMIEVYIDANDGHVDIVGGSAANG